MINISLATRIKHQTIHTRVINHVLKTQIFCSVRRSTVRRLQVRLNDNKKSTRIVKYRSIQFFASTRPVTTKELKVKVLFKKILAQSIQRKIQAPPSRRWTYRNLSITAPLTPNSIRKIVKP